MINTNCCGKVIIGSDHAAFYLKENLKIFLKKVCLIDVVDAGTYNEKPIDYPDVGLFVASQISNNVYNQGILICGTGIGMSIVANRFPGVRAALCSSVFTAEMSKLHNNSNILVMGSRIITEHLAMEVTKTWLETPFESGRHQRRLNKFDSI